MEHLGLVASSVKSGLLTISGGPQVAVLSRRQTLVSQLFTFHCGLVSFQHGKSVSHVDTQLVWSDVRG